MSPCPASPALESVQIPPFSSPYSVDSQNVLLRVAQLARCLIETTETTTPAKNVTRWLLSGSAIGVTHAIDCHDNRIDLR